MFRSAPLLPLLLLSLPAAGEQVRVLSGPLAPFAWEDAGRQRGIIVDVFAGIKQRTGFKGDVESMIWPRALKLSEKDNMVVFPLARVPYREGKYLWVGPILTSPHIFLMRRDDKRKIAGMDSLKKLSIAVLRDAPPHKILKKEGFTNLYPVSATGRIAPMLIKGRVDAWYDMEAIMYHTVKNAGIRHDKLKNVLIHIPVKMHIGLSKNLAKLAGSWQKTWEKMRADGTAQSIENRYLARDVWPVVPSVH